jgi:hypothetical protein
VKAEHLPPFQLGRTTAPLTSCAYAAPSPGAACGAAVGASSAGTGEVAGTGEAPRCGKLSLFVNVRCVPNFPTRALDAAC